MTKKGIEMAVKRTLLLMGAFFLAVIAEACKKDFYKRRNLDNEEANDNRGTFQQNLWDTERKRKSAGYSGFPNAPAAWGIICITSTIVLQYQSAGMGK